VIRVVVDANVLLAGVVSAPESPPALLLNALEQGRLEAIACPRFLQELQHGLDRPFFSERLDVERARQVV
jgi:predicted nucleic acid-binding protein